jgi:lipopolysaccharide export system permease protein
MFRDTTTNVAQLPVQQPATVVASQDTERRDTVRRDTLLKDTLRAPIPVPVIPPSQTPAIAPPQTSVAVTPTPTPVNAPPVTTQVTQQDSTVDSLTRAQTPTPLPVPTPVAQPDTVPDSLKVPVQPIVPPQTQIATPQGDSMFVVSNFMSVTTQLVSARMTLDQLAVEIHKKFALSFACLIFVLFGPPIALRFPRGGVGVTIGVSIVVFGAYYVCLMGGEALADNGKLPPSIAMWIANAIFGLAGVLLLWRVERTTDSSRGGGIGDWWADRKTMRALRRAEKAQRKAIRAATPAGAQ